MSVSCGDDRKQIHPWCSVCLVSHLRMCSIQNNSELRQIYDKLTNTKFNNDCGTPEAICYICYSQLKRAHKFSDMAQKSQMILQELRQQGIEPYKMAIMPNFGIAINLSPSGVTNTSIPHNTNNENVEPSDTHPITKSPHNSIKTEPIDETSSIPEDEKYFLENKRQLAINDKAVEEMYILENTSMVSNNDEADEINAVDDIDAIDNIDAVDNKDAIDVFDDTEMVNADSKPSEDDIAKLNSELNILDEDTTSQNEFIFDMKPVNIPKEIILENGIKISIGDRAFASITSNEDIIVPHKRTKYTHMCKVCKRTYASEENLRRHIINNKEHKRYPCVNCNRTLPSARALKYHLAVHAGKKPYACNFCDKAFYQKIHMHRHIRTHTGEKPYFCKICSKSYSDQSYFKIHLLSHAEQKPFPCDLCKKSFTQRKTMERHRESHSGLKPFKCDVCLNSFSSKSAVRAHMVFHSGLMLYKCKYCNKRYSQRRYLISHLSMHSNERPYVCQLCNKAYTRKSTLCNHMKFIHKVILSKDRPYVCQFCNKVYTRKNNLRSHMKIHVKQGNSQAGLPGSQVRGPGQDNAADDLQTPEPL